jgi:predicted nucleotidyltransferase
MKPSAALEMHREDIRRIVASRRALNPRVFGSVLHGEDTEESDLDILVDTTSRTSLFDLNAISNALEALLGVPVDVLTPKSLPAEWRSQVLAEAKSI